jgi:adenylate cyclase class IV
LYLLDRTRVHLDVVEGLGCFVELEVVLADGESTEAGGLVARQLLCALGIAQGALVEGAYLDLATVRQVEPLVAR